MMKKLCIYHGNCADGFGAALAVRTGLGKENVEFYAGVYQEDPPDVTGREVIMVDFSYKKPVIIEMASKAKNILIIDHHKSAQEDLIGLPDNVNVCFDMNRSGAMMAWEYFCSDIPRPKLIDHIQDRDLWRFELKGTREIQAAVFSYPYDFEVWESLMLDDLALLRNEGRVIERKHFKDINELINTAAYRMNIAGYEVPVLNAPYFFSSDAGHIMAENEIFAACYWDTPNGRIFSLRSSKKGIDVSEIAKIYGGGGHKHAAGFNLGFNELNKLNEKEIRTTK